MVPSPLSEYVASRRMGEATVTVIRDGTFPWAPRMQAPEAEWRRAMPEANAAGELMIDMNVVHIRLGDASILVDLGFQEDAAGHMPRLRRTPGVLAGLASTGVDPEDITHVLITHTHGDHVEAATIRRNGDLVARFPRARYLIGRAEWAENPARERPDSPLAIHLGTIERLGLLDLVDGDREIVPGVTMMHTPGDSPGHAIIRVQSAGEDFYALGDLFHHVCEVEHLDWVPAGRDQAATLASRRRLLAEAVPSRATLVFAHHDFPAWGRIDASGAGYQWQRV